MTMTFEEYEFLRSVGGRAIAKRGTYATSPDDTTEWNFGLLQPSHPGNLKLTTALAKQDKAHRKAIGTFKHTVHVNDDTDNIDLTQTWKHPLVTQGLGRSFQGFGQLTGSCVGAGGGNNQATMNFLEVVILKQPEKIYMPFWPLMYGRSRLYMGDHNRGEGSMESTWDKARVDGVLPASTAGLPTFFEQGGLLHIGSNNEMMWSDGDSKPLIDYLSAARAHPITGSSVCRSAEDVWNAIGSLQVVGHGSMYGYNVVGTDEGGEALGKRGPRWSHKETILGRRVRNGKREFKNVNQWFYQGACQVWIPEVDVEWICNDGEVIAYSGLQGIPEDELRWVDWTQLPT